MEREGAGGGQPLSSLLTEALARLKVRDASDFEWLKNVRVYWRGDGVVASICDADFDYSYEYLGTRERREEGVARSHPQLSPPSPSSSPLF